MHACWENKDPVARFWRRLIRERAVEFMRSADFMKKLRYHPDEAKDLQKRFGKVWAEYGTDVYRLIAEAHNEKWDEEDEQKSSFARQEAKKESAINQRDNDDLVAARKTGTFERVDEFQGVVEESLGILEEKEERRIRGLLELSGAEEEAARQKEEESGGRGGRREGFYRRAGGT